MKPAYFLIFPKEGKRRKLIARQKESVRILKMPGIFKRFCCLKRLLTEELSNHKWYEYMNVLSRQMTVWFPFETCALTSLTAFLSFLQNEPAFSAASPGSASSSTLPGLTTWDFETQRNFEFKPSLKFYDERKNEQNIKFIRME